MKRKLHRPISQRLSRLEQLELRRLFHDGVGLKINFQLPTSPMLASYDVDYGAAYADQGEGIFYGWDRDNTANVHARHIRATPATAGLAAQYKDYAILPAGSTNVWEIGLPNDDYTVRIVAGDAASAAGRYRIKAEGVLTVDGTASSENRFVEGTQTVSVNDGRLTLSGVGSGTNKIAFIEILPWDDATTVSVTADPSVSLRGAHDGGFVFTRTGSVSSAATYDYRVGGSATPDEDYDALPGAITFPAGSAEVKVPVSTQFASLHASKTVMVTLVPGDEFLLDSVSATTSIAGFPKVSDQTATTGTDFSTTRISFQPEGSIMPDYYKADTGAAYGLRGNGLTYGWSADNRTNTREHNNPIAPDQRYDTLIHTQKSGIYTWEMAVPNGTYTARVVAGDSDYTDSVLKYNVEGVLTVNGKPSAASHWVEGTKTVTVSDGRLTISNATGAQNNKLAFVEIAPGANRLPVISLAASGQPGEASGSGTFTFTRTGSLSQALEATYTLGGTAINGTDYSPLSGAVTFAAGAASATVSLHPLDDPTPEGNETVILTLATAANYSNGAIETATRTISDNDVNNSSGTLKWKTYAPSPSVRAEAMGAYVDGRVFAFGGYVDSTYHPTARVDLYDVALNKWTRLSDMPFGALTHAGVTTSGQYVYLAGGYPGSATKGQTFSTTSVWRYDTTNDTWQQMPSLPAARGAGALARVGDELYFIGGSDSSRADRSEVFSLDLDDLNDGWTQRANMPAARNHVGGAALDGYVYAIGGQTGQDKLSVFKSDVWRYNPETDKWATVASLMNQPRSHINAAAFAFNGKIVIEGGEGPGRVPLRNVEQYDAATNKWTALQPLPAGRSSGIGVSLGDRLLFTSGYSGKFESQMWIGAFS